MSILTKAKQVILGLELISVADLEAVLVDFITDLDIDDDNQISVDEIVTGLKRAIRKIKARRI